MSNTEQPIFIIYEIHFDLFTMIAFYYNAQTSREIHILSGL